MFDVYLKGALQEEGCALCRLRRQAEARYVFHTLWENVNDMTFRLRFLGSEGLCPEHAWQFQATEARLWHDGLKNGILYESLLAAARRELIRQAQVRQQEARPWWHPARWLRRSPPPSLPPPGPCPVCVIGEHDEQFYAHELAKRLQEDAWRQAYRASDGLCWPHLRLALVAAEPDTARWLRMETENRLAILHHDLNEYLRKHSWQFHDEPVSMAEKQAWIRAIAFLRGERPATEEKS